MTRARLYLAVALGSAIGGSLRWLASELIHAWSGAGFPWGTLFVNVTGSLAIGFYAALAGPDGRLLAGARQRQFVMTGICGGYTTFSVFSLETLRLAQAGAAPWLRFDGAARVEQLDVVDRALRQPLASWDALGLEGMALALAPDFLPSRLARALLLQQTKASEQAAIELQAARRQAELVGQDARVAREEGHGPRERQHEPERPQPVRAQGSLEARPREAAAHGPARHEDRALEEARVGGHDLRREARVGGGQRLQVDLVDDRTAAEAVDHIAAYLQRLKGPDLERIRENLKRLTEYAGKQKWPHDQALFLKEFLANHGVVPEGEA